MKTERRLKTEDGRLMAEGRKIKREDWKQKKIRQRGRLRTIPENWEQRKEDWRRNIKDKREKTDSRKQETENRKRRKNWVKTGHKRRTLIMMTEEWRLKTEGIKLRKEGKREHLKDHWRQVRWKNRKRTGGKEKRVTTSERRLKTEGR